MAFKGQSMIIRRLSLRIDFEGELNVTD